MDATTCGKNEAQWLNDARGAPRWCDARTVLARLEGEEYLGKVRNLSLTGVCVAVQDAPVSLGARVSLFVVYEDRLVEVGGTVVHARPEAGGSVVGVACAPLADGTRRFLSERYKPDPPLGSVK